AVDACLAPSAEMGAHARDFGIPAERIHFLPNGIDTLAFRPAAPDERAALRRALGVEGDGPLVLYVGRLSPEKGPSVLLDAWERVAATAPGARLALVGGGPEAAGLRARLAGSPAASSVHLHGPDHDTARWFRAADLFVLPSLREGLSNALLEALGCGLPVVSTRVSGSVDAFAAADLGELATPGDAAGLAAALSRLLADPGRRLACGAAARELAVREYALERVVDRLERIYAGG
ncbi:MAG TPA: glycosyltransferase family 4 protein, partial [Longimicrobiaceae bacterium]|nr:glycosyltransferase family 4 protein [Longimicrobiaceae bacterium]